MKVGIIGCGLIGKKRAENLSQSKLVAVADTCQQKAESFKVFNQQIEIFDDWKKLIKLSHIDIVIVSTPNNLLTPIALSAIQAGKHVILEKPAGISLKELQTLRETTANSNRLVKVGFNHRFHPAILKAREIVDSGELGELMYIRGRYGHGGRKGYEKEWRADPRISGGGELIDQGVHLIDLSRWFLGDFSKIDGFVHNYFWDMPVDDNCFISLRNNKNQHAWLHASCSEWKNMFSFEIYGHNGKLSIDGLGGSYGTEKITFYKMLPEMGPPMTTSWEFPMKDKSWDLEYRNFLDAIKNKSKILGSVADAYEAMKIVDTLYKENGYDYNEKPS